MKAAIAAALLCGACAWALGADAQSIAPVPLSSGSPVPPGASAVPVSSGAPLPPGASAVPPGASPGGVTTSAPQLPGARDVPAPATPSPAPSPTAAGRAHLHRPGTDVEGDVLTGSLASEVYILKGNVTLHSDPKIDRAISAASESDAPLTVTADEVDVDRVGTTYVAKGNVRFVQGSRSGRADTAMLDEQTHTLDLVGNANVLDGDHRAAAAKMHYNMLDKQFLGSGNVRIYQPLPTPNPNASGTPPPTKRKRRLPL